MGENIEEVNKLDDFQRSCYAREKGQAQQDADYYAVVELVVKDKAGVIVYGPQGAQLDGDVLLCICHPRGKGQ
jgi:hypothetical protein